jgi:hypothetical protein
LVYFSRFGMLCKEKSGNPDRWSESSNQKQKELYVQCHKISIRNTFLQNSSLVLDRVWLGWPDWVTWDSFLKITEVAHMFGPQFPMIKVYKNGWAKFGHFFRKLIWQPWFGHIASICSQPKQQMRCWKTKLDISQMIITQLIWFWKVTHQGLKLKPAWIGGLTNFRTNIQVPVNRCNQMGRIWWCRLFEFWTEVWVRLFGNLWPIFCCHVCWHPWTTFQFRLVVVVRKICSS